jgi:hypothetical protein
MVVSRMFATGAEQVIAAPAFVALQSMHKKRALNYYFGEVFLVAFLMYS